MQVALCKNSSIMINLIRSIACQCVLIGHSLYYLGIYPYKERTFAIQSVAVSVFFLLSGFLTVYSCYRKRQNLGDTYTFSDFIINRISRIYPALIIAIIVITVIDFLSLTLFPDGYGYEKSFNFKTALANLLMIPNFPISLEIPLFGLSVFASARPFWTLSIEWWLYVIFAFYYFLFIKNKFKISFWIAVVLAGIIPFHHLVSGNGNGLSFTWLLGVAVFVGYITPTPQRQGIYIPPLGALVFICVLIGLLRCQVVKENYGLLYDPMAAVFFALAFSIGLRGCETGIFSFSYCRKPAKFLSSFSYTLYLTHYSLLDFFCNLFSTEINRYLVLVFLIVFCNIFAWALSLLGERYLPGKLENLLKKLYGGLNKHRCKEY